MRYSAIFVRCWISLVLCAALAGCASTPPPLMPPVAMRQPQRVNLGNQMVTDDYWWLRNRDDPKVIDYLKAENAYTAAKLKPTEALQTQLYNEFISRIRQTDETVPYRIGDWWYSMRTVQGDQYPIYLRRKGSPTAPPVVIADVNELAKGHAYFDYIPGEVGLDGNLLAFSTDTTGNRQYILQVKDLRTGEVLPDNIPLADTYTWMTDNRTLYYTKEDDSKRSYRLYRHVLGSPVDKDDLIYEEKDDAFSIDVYHTRDRKYIVCDSSSKTENEARILPGDAIAPPRLIEPRRADMEYYVEHRNGRFYIRTNDTDWNFRIVSAPDDAPGKANWTELVAADPAVVIDDFDVFSHDLVLSQRHDGLPQLAISALPEAPGDPAAAGKLKPRQLHFSEPDYDVEMGDNPEFDPSAIRFTYTSLTTPVSEYDFSLADGTQTLLKQQYVGGGFDASNYHEERLFATSHDGTKIPISLVYRINKKTETVSPIPIKPRPTLMEGYGAYGISSDVYFSSSRLSLLDRGMIFAIAHVRGGGEYGRAWYDAGRLKNKINTFADFIDAARYLEYNGWTTPDEMAIEGGSAGGLLIGTVLNRDPELFHAAIAEVPWVDVLADMSDPSIPLTTLEYKEWGNPNIPEQRAWIAAYDPYTNVAPQAYPNLLVMESLNDSQVQYWDSARWVAKLRAAKADAQPEDHSELLLKMDMDAGHSGASGRYTELHEIALEDAWLLVKLGVEK